MSAAQSNTQQASFNSRGGKFSRGASVRSGSSLEESAEFKNLRAKYSSSLKTLSEMFPDWTDADLLYALKEADGNLEITIGRIAEGHATQWDEVKSRKEKRQVAKQHEDSKPFEKSAPVPRPASFRGGVRGGAARGGRGGHSNVASGRAGRPAPAPAKAPAASASSADPAAGWDIDTTTNTKPLAGAWAAKAASSSENAKNKEQGAKQTSPEPAVSEKKPAESAPANKKSAPAVKESLLEASTPAEEESEANPSPDAAIAEQTKPEETVATVVVESVVEMVEVEKTPIEEPAEQAAVTQESEPAVPEPAAEEAQTAAAASTSTSTSTAKKPASNSRRLNQEAPVVMPTGNTPIERIGMQFGSLSIGGLEFGSLKSSAVAETAETEKPAVAEAAAPQAEAKETAAAAAAPVAAAAPAAAVNVETAPAASAIPASTPTAAPAAAAAAVPVPVAPAAAPAAAEPVAAVSQGPLTTYLQQQQQQQQQQQFVQSHAQTHPSANAISQMPLPNDYGAAALYGADAAQRNMMGFYDNYGYGQFMANKDTAAATTSATEPQAAATSGPQAAGINGATNLGQAGLFPQQMLQPFGMNHGMPYYNPYYYNMMQPGTQFPNPAAFGNNPALAAAYGQPFMKQGVYPMYPGATPQGLQNVGSQQQQAQQQQQQGGQQSAQQGGQGSQQAGQQGSVGNQQVNSQQAGAKGASQASTNPYANINAQKSGNPYGHYSANIGAGFGVYEQQDPAALSNSPQQFGLGGIPGIFSASKAGSKDPNAKGIPPTGNAPVIGGTTYYSTPQQLGGYPSQVNNTHPGGFSHHQQAYYASYAPSYGQTHTPHMYQHQHQHQQPPQSGHQQPGKQYWEKQ
ncbi:RNAPII degradation factor [Coemansia sp. Benny D115]|nr:RNAPII degradation factor [Coemansia sp. Benny D115]